MSVSDEVKKDIDIYFEETYMYFFFRKGKMLLHSFSDWTLVCQLAKSISSMTMGFKFVCWCPTFGIW